MIQTTPIRYLAVALLAASLIGCRNDSSPPEPAKASKAPANGPVDPWVLSTTDPKNPTPAVLWNGLIGVRIGRDGTAIDDQDRPGLFAIDEYETEGEEKIKPVIGNALSGGITMGDMDLSDDMSSGYLQALDMRTGMLRTWWKSKEGVETECLTVMHPEKRILGQQWRIKTSPKARFSVVHTCTVLSNAKDSGSLQDGFWTITESGMRAHIRYRIKGVSDAEWTSVNGGVRLNGSADAAGIVEFQRVVSFGRSPNGKKMAMARMPADYDWSADYDKPERLLTFEQLRAETAAYWAKAWETDIEIDGPVEDQQAVRSFLFYLRSAIHPDGQMSISPFALSNARYNGHVFWDADVWVFPALALIDPGRARAIPQYRLATAKPKRIGEFRGYGPQFTLQYPWESSVSGLETAPPEMRREIHVSGSVMNMLVQAKALGLTDVDLSPIQQAVANYYRSEASFDRDKDGEYRFKNVISPDEFHTGDNDLYTNLVASWIEASPVFFKRADGRLDSEDSIPVYLPRDSTTFLTYDGDPLNRKYKQAAAVLAIYPLQYPPAEAEARLMMDRYADMITPNGPAMSDSIHAIIWARMGEKEKAYETWRRSWQRYTDHPLMLFSEKPAKEETYFTTGAAGCLQTVLYGFLGFRIDYKKDSKALWSKPLSDGQVLSVKPNLPPQWKSVKLKNFTVLGKRYTLTATHDSAQVAEAR